ncbi:helix-turn-helix transcriptional regulator [Sorangium sp. So ce134]
MPRRTRGAVLVARLGLDQVVIARRCGVARSTVGHWITGVRKPLDTHRVILRDVYGVPPDAWLEPAVDNTAVCYTL